MNELWAYKGDLPYIFISYAHRDTERVFPLLVALQDAGYRFWFDQGIEVGTEWSNNIAEHLSGCSAFLFFASKNSVASENCLDEVAYAKSHNKPAVLAYLEEDVILPSGTDMQTARFQRMYVNRQTSLEGFVESFSAAAIFDGCREEKAQPENIPVEPVVAPPPAPTPIPQPAPQPVVEPNPQPTAEPTPVFLPAPEPIPQPIPQPISEVPVYAPIPEQPAVDVPEQPVVAEQPPKKKKKKFKKLLIIAAAVILTIAAILIITDIGMNTYEAPVRLNTVYTEKLSFSARADMCNGFGSLQFHIINSIIEKSSVADELKETWSDQKDSYYNIYGSDYDFSYTVNSKTELSEAELSSVETHLEEKGIDYQTAADTLEGNVDGYAAELGISSLEVRILSAALSSLGEKMASANATEGYLLEVTYIFEGGNLSTPNTYDTSLYVCKVDGRWICPGHLTTILIYP